MPNELKIGRVYRHFKGDLLSGGGRCQRFRNGGALCGLPQALRDGGLWLRPLAMFLSPVDRAKYPDAAQEYRFELQEIPSAAGH